MSRLRLSLLAAVTAMLLTGLPAQASIPKVLTYSGYVKTAAGVAVTTPTDLTFRLYTGASGGAAVWTEAVSVTPTSDGWFSAVLGTTTTLVAATFDQDLYLSLQVGTDLELTPRARVTPSGSALVVDWSGVQGKPTCATGQYLTLDGIGSLVCTTPTTGTGGLTSVLTAAPISGTGVSGSAVTLTPCANGQILQSNGTTWSCIATPTGGTGSGVTSVGVVAPIVSTGGNTPTLSMPAASAISSGYITPVDYSAFAGKAPSPGATACLSNQVLTWTGTAFTCVNDQNSGGTVTGVTATAPVVAIGSTAVNLSMAAASASANGYLSATDWSTFNAKAPTASPVFSGTVSASTVTATTFVGSLSGNASSATTATTALSANAVAANVITPSDLTTGTAPGNGQVPSKATGDTFTWVSPLAPPAASCGANQVLTWNGSALTCVVDANSGGTITSVTAGAGLTGGGTTGGVTLFANFAGSGTANTVARSDHTHNINQVVPLSDLALGTGVTFVASMPLGANGRVLRGIVVPINGVMQMAISGTTPVPLAGVPTATLRVIIHNPAATAQTYNFITGSSGLVQGAALPYSMWGNSLNTVTVAANATAIVQWNVSTQVTISGCSTPPSTCLTPGVGDLLWFTFGANSSTGPAYDVLGVQVEF